LKRGQNSIAGTQSDIVDCRIISKNASYKKKPNQIYEQKQDILGNVSLEVKREITINCRKSK